MSFFGRRKNFLGSDFSTQPSRMYDEMNERDGSGARAYSNQLYNNVSYNDIATKKVSHDDKLFFENMTTKIQYEMLTDMILDLFDVFLLRYSTILLWTCFILLILK